MKKQKTIYHLIVDKSSSMCDCIENTIMGFNEQVAKITHMEKEFQEQDITIGLTTFNHRVYHHFFQSQPGKVQKLTEKDLPAQWQYCFTGCYWQHRARNGK